MNKNLSPLVAILVSIKTEEQDGYEIPIDTVHLPVDSSYQVPEGYKEVERYRPNPALFEF